MLAAFFPPPVLGVLAFLLIALNTVFWCVPFYGLTLIKVLLPNAQWRRGCTRLLYMIAEIWSSGLCRIIDFAYDIDWDVAGLEGLRNNCSYLLSANHQSWVDVLVLQYLFTRRIPFPRYFAKRELLWIPLIGGALWALEFPLMKRYSKGFLRKHPELRGKDLETTRKACERYRGEAVTVVIFIEGTRFRWHKHAAQHSPYRHLLLPKAGGLAFILNAMEENFEAMLDVIIVYPDGTRGFWGFLCGRVRRISVHVRQRAIPRVLLGGNYLQDPEHRERIQLWVRELWQEKDDMIERLQRQADEGN